MQSIFTTDAESAHREAVARFQRLRAELSKAGDDVNYTKGLLDMSIRRDEEIASQSSTNGVESMGEHHAK